ncbi:MAG: 2-amino-4-hydroxy-6-hydroxymethyldihydropteridine diphosphokinase [Deltaproteobacteria bacterium]|jgi:2-amino-4-hydroxy-6-hydroxymethyldihydropteridine diphosphokinase|nr:2-amino-4-hydroxy-6-hydroxymethyldihydropteridine diphosphokinase [Deltaproteobacteria bacterium]
MQKKTFNYSQIAYVSLGSNSDDSPGKLRAALAELAELPATELLSASGLYRTEPQGDPDQPWFLNQVAALRSGLDPEELLAAMLKIETRLGRLRDPARRFGPRSIDLDLLLYGDLVMDSQNLILPHPRMFKRAFVLLPLMDIAEEPLRSEVSAALGKLNYFLNGDRIYQNAE